MRNKACATIYLLSACFCFYGAISLLFGGMPLMENIGIIAVGVLLLGIGSIVEK